MAIFRGRLQTEVERLRQAQPEKTIDLQGISITDPEFGPGDCIGATIEWQVTYQKSLLIFKPVLIAKVVINGFLRTTTWRDRRAVRIMRNLGVQPKSCKLSEPVVKRENQLLFLTDAISNIDYQINIATSDIKYLEKKIKNLERERSKLEK